MPYEISVRRIHHAGFFDHASNHKEFDTANEEARNHFNLLSGQNAPSNEHGYYEDLETGFAVFVGQPTD